MDTVQLILSLTISLSTVFGIFTALINKLFSKKLEPLEKKITDEHINSLKKDMEQWRFMVVSFGGDLHAGMPKTRFEFESIFTLIDEYESAVEELNIKNSVFHEEVLYIKDCYHRLIGTK